MTEPATAHNESSHPPQSDRALSKKPRPAMKDRLTLVEQMVFQPSAEGPISFDHVSTRWLEGVGGQPYARKLKAHSTPILLDFGWIDDCPAMLNIVNDEGRFRVNPTPEQTEESEAKVLILSVQAVDSDVCVAFAEVLPQSRASFRPTKGCKYWAVCPSGDMKFTILAIPR